MVINVYPMGVSIDDFQGFSQLEVRFTLAIYVYEYVWCAISIWSWKFVIAMIHNNVQDPTDIR